MTHKEELRHLAEAVYNLRSDLDRIIDSIEKVQEKLLDLNIAISDEIATLTE